MAGTNSFIHSENIQWLLVSNQKTGYNSGFHLNIITMKTSITIENDRIHIMVVNYDSVKRLDEYIDLSPGSEHMDQNQILLCNLATIHRLIGEMEAKSKE